ncbi:MAG TPA: beta-ketoacyl-ACP synthase II [Polyangiaceae bacterium]|nr:beta-ketoacyl-ACP synthase II [Polyangiaceae bacterium]
MKKRAVITGIGLMTPLAVGRDESWRRLVAGTSGIRRFTLFDPSRLKTQFGGEVPDFDPGRWLDKPSVRRTDRYTQLAIAAADEAMTDAGLALAPSSAPRAGVLLGVALGGLASLEHHHALLLDKGPERMNPFMVPMMLANTAPGMLAIRHGAQGPNYTVTSACASGAHAIGESLELIRRGVADVMITGGVESTLTELCVSGFCAMRALSTRNDAPAQASRPFSLGRDGFVIAEGAGIVILEELEHARARGARIYAEVAGYGLSADAHHITAPHPEGQGVVLAIERALSSAGLTPNDVEHVNAHATSTPAGDEGEARALRRVFGARADDILVTAPKSMIGHTLGAAGGIETAFLALTLHHSLIPPTINYDEPDRALGLTVVSGGAREGRVDVALKNSFGFGGTNASLVLRRFDGRGGV